MENNIENIFNKMAQSYDERYSKVRAIKDALYLSMQGFFQELPQNSKVLCVGAGTGDELIYFAKMFPNWEFTLVEPASSMLDVCKKKAKDENILQRCKFHTGYLETLPNLDSFDITMTILVSQFIKDKTERISFYKEIASRLKKDGLLISADLSGDMSNNNFKVLLDSWKNIHEMTDDQVVNLKNQWSDNLGFISPSEIEEIIKSGGFKSPILFYQNLFIHAWYSKKV